VPVADDALMADLYSASDLLLFPTLEEGFGYPVIEAFASGLPVVASDIEVMREVSAGAALLADPEDPAALAASCRTAVERSDELRQGGFERVEEYRFERFVARLAHFYAGFAE